MSNCQVCIRSNQACVQTPLLLRECEGWKWHTGFAEEQSSYDNEVGVNANAGYIWKLKQVLWERLICGQMLVSKESRDAWAPCYLNGWWRCSSWF